MKTRPIPSTVMLSGIAMGVGAAVGVVAAAGVCTLLNWPIYGLLLLLALVGGMLAASLRICLIYIAGLEAHIEHLEKAQANFRKVFNAQQVVRRLRVKDGQLVEKDDQ